MSKFVTPPRRFARVAIVSDTHGYLDERVAAIVATCDYAVHAGDISKASVLEALKPQQRRVVAVAGNNDLSHMWSATESHIADGLPEVAELELPGGKLVVEHGHKHGMSSPCHDSLRQAYPEARVIVYGHTHKLVIDKSSSPWVINPGAAGRVRTHGGPSCLVLIADKNQWSVEMQRFSTIAA
ncbi:MAG: metallophosphoesterase family protein [Gammaproteobacteria bacterium]|nr:metallophosphoesterase family protein [Gammaproteobacteria bacterium]